MVSGAGATPTLGRARPAVASMPRGVRADIVSLYCNHKPILPGFARRVGPSSLKEAAPNVGCAAHTLETASSTEAVAAGGKNVTYEEDAKGVTRLSLRKEGWSSWDFEGERVNYLQAGTEGPPLLLIHGFGASVYHWRYNIPELAKNHRVYALDMLGFGWSDKPITDYGSCRLWVRQVARFIQDVILQGSDDPSLPRPVVVGNSLGGWVALNTATDEPELVQAVVLVNAAGRLEEPAAAGDAGQAAKASSPGAVQKAWQQLAAAGQQLVKRAGAYVAFLSSKQRSNVERVLSQVYVSQDNLDDELVESILAPAEHPNAAQVFYLTMQQSGGRTMTGALAQCQKPLHLIWGERDPWITPSKAQRVLQLYPSATLVMLDAGHCPHDDAPQPFNQALLEYMRSVHA